MKFIVLKVDDIEKYCSFEQKMQLTDICKQIREERKKDGKNIQNNYLIVNTDEPYANKVKSLIEKHEGEKVILD